MNQLANPKLMRSKAERCAKEIIDWLIKHEMWMDTMIYVNGKRYSCYNGKEYKYDNTWDCVFVEDNVDPHKYLQYAGDYLSMSFEGPMYDVLNYGYENPVYEKWEEEFSQICKKYGKYYELGHAWNLSLYDL